MALDGPLGRRPFFSASDDWPVLAIKKDSRKDDASREKLIDQPGMVRRNGQGQNAGVEVADLVVARRAGRFATLSRGLGVNGQATDSVSDCLRLKHLNSSMARRSVEGCQTTSRRIVRIIKTVDEESLLND
ncbi:hypothetical protein WN48_07626 [Eufriesea mexicana]|uniref:Uncharacterized protein n=1 Tax=Eufriesea mexicana TaxID=516756 RepID=A0A310SY45_9HYME|nr:hypothetical protein WN48_07626 [Eufriesea mexicana]